MSEPELPRQAHPRRQVVRDLLALLGLAALILATGLGVRDPWPADEPRFALIAKDMIAGGEWLFPHVGGDWYQDKPPLFFWSIALLYAVTGSLRLAFLLPSLLAALGTLALVYDLGRRLWDRQTGFAAAFALLFTVEFSLRAHLGQIDALLCSASGRRSPSTACVVNCCWVTAGSGTRSAASRPASA